MKFTPRETDILRRLARGWNLDQIAADLCISVHTVRVNTSRIRASLWGPRLSSSTYVKHSIDNEADVVASEHD